MQRKETRNNSDHEVSQVENFNGVITSPNQEHPNTMKLGTAEWEYPEEVQQRYLFDHGQFWLGRSTTVDLKPLGFNDDRHICLVSGSRGGKGTTTIINNLCLWPGSVVVVDPKGENATVTAAARGEGSPNCDGMGQSVYVLDPFKAAHVDEKYRKRFNPLDVLDPNDDDVIDDAASIAAALVVQEKSDDPFWENSARRLLLGIILYVLTEPQYEGQRNLNTVRQLILRGAWESVERAKKRGAKKIPPAHQFLWMLMQKSKFFDGLVSGIGGRMLNQATTAERQAEGVLEHLNVNTAFLDSPGMKRCVEKSDFELSELKTSAIGVSLYLSIPQRYMTEHFRWLRMMITLIVNEMEKTPGQPRTGHRVLMCLDEFASLKKMESIEVAVAQIAGYGVKLFFVLQTLEQLKHVYKDNWETFLSNAGLKIFYGIEDHFTREYVSKLIGETEVSRDTNTRSDSESDSESTTDSESENRGISQFSSEGTSHTDSKSSNTSRNRSLNLQLGRNKNRSQRVTGLLQLYDGDPQKARGGQFGGGYGRGKQSGTGESHSDGTSTNEGSGESETFGTSQSKTTGTSNASTTGVNETLHKRPLIAPDEIGRLFGRIDDVIHPGYPGYALVIVSGRSPFPVKKANYFQDPQFARCYDPHADHEHNPVDVPLWNRQLELKLDRLEREQSFLTKKAEFEDKIRLLQEPSAPPQTVLAVEGPSKDALEYRYIRGRKPEFRLVWLIDKGHPIPPKSYLEDNATSEQLIFDMQQKCENAFEATSLKINIPEIREGIFYWVHPDLDVKADEEYGFIVGTAREELVFIETASKVDYEAVEILNEKTKEEWKSTSRGAYWFRMGRVVGSLVWLPAVVICVFAFLGVGWGIGAAIFVGMGLKEYAKQFNNFEEYLERVEDARMSVFPDKPDEELDFPKISLVENHLSEPSFYAEIERKKNLEEAEREYESFLKASEFA